MSERGDGGGRGGYRFRRYGYGQVNYPYLPPLLVERTNRKTDGKKKGTPLRKPD